MQGHLPTWAREYTGLCRNLLRTVCPAAMFTVVRCLWLACLLFTPLGPDHLVPWWNIVLRQVVDGLCYWWKRWLSIEIGILNTTTYRFRILRGHRFDDLRVRSSSLPTDTIDQVSSVFMSSLLRVGAFRPEGSNFLSIEAATTVSKCRTFPNGSDPWYVPQVIALDIPNIRKGIL